MPPARYEVAAAAVVVVVVAAAATAAAVARGKREASGRRDRARWVTRSMPSFTRATNVKRGMLRPTAALSGVRGGTRSKKGGV